MLIAASLAKEFEFPQNYVFGRRIPNLIFSYSTQATPFESPFPIRMPTRGIEIRFLSGIKMDHIEMSMRRTGEFVGQHF